MPAKALGEPEGTEGYIEAIQEKRKDLSRAMILRMIQEEQAKSGDMLTQEGAAHLLWMDVANLPTPIPTEIPSSEESIEQPEEPPEPEGPPGYEPSFAPADKAPRLPTKFEAEVMKKLTEAVNLDSSHFKVEEGSEGITVEAVRFVADRWNDVNGFLEGMGFDYVNAGGREGVKIWAMSLPKHKVVAKEEKPKKAAQLRMENPKTIRELESLLVEKYQPAILKSVIVTENSKNLEVEPQTKLPPKQVESITDFLAKFGATLEDTGIPPGYCWVIKK